MSSGLQADLEMRRGDLRLQLALEAADDEVVAIVGPNGSGKTTALRALAGLVHLDAGRVTLGGTVLDDVEAGIHVAPERRSAALVFQDPLLLPHLSVIDNIAFGVRSHGRARSEARGEAGAWLERVGLAALGARRPRGLSGGEAQRVAIARALATRPRLLLLDEPLAGVDAQARVELRRLLREVIAGLGATSLLVTHDPLEAMALAQRILVLEAGRVTQAGGVAEVVERPRSPWVAAMIGVNLFAGDAAGAVLELAGGERLAVLTQVRGPAFAVVHPRAVALHRDRPQGSPRNCWRGTARSVDLEGDRARVRVEGPLPVVAEVTVAAVADLHLDEGGPVWVTVKATEVSVYPA